METQLNSQTLPPLQISESTGNFFDELSPGTEADLLCLKEEISRLTSEVLAAKSAQNDAESTLLLLREKTREKFLALKNENETLTLQLSEERGKPKSVVSNDSAGKNEQIANLKSIILSMQGEYENVKLKLSSLSKEQEELMEIVNRLRKREHELNGELALFKDEYNNKKDGRIILTIQNDGILWGLSEKDKWFKMSAEQPDLPKSIDYKLKEALDTNVQLASDLKDTKFEFDQVVSENKNKSAEIVSLNKSIENLMKESSAKVVTMNCGEHTPPSIVGSSYSVPTTPPHTTPLPMAAWALERQRLQRAVIAAEQSLHAEMESRTRLLIELESLKKDLLKSNENQQLMSSSQDSTKVLYAKNIFLKLTSIAPGGSPEFEQLLLVLAAFFQIPVNDANYARNKSRNIILNPFS